MKAEHRHEGGQGPVVLDIGDDRGALVLHAPAALAGAEIEISPADDDTARSHVAVLPRPTNGRIAHAAVYPSLAAGSYRLWRADGLPTESVVIRPGAVTEVQWEAIAKD